MDRLDRSMEARVTSWRLQEAKQRFSEFVRRAEREGPQLITRHGEETVVMVHVEEYRCMRERGGGAVVTAEEERANGYFGHRRGHGTPRGAFSISKAF